MPEPLILPFGPHRPRIHATAFIAPTAVIIGDVEIGAHSSVFYGAVLRGDTAPIRIGEHVNLQDSVVVHCDGDAPTTLGDFVTVGHHALVHGTTVGRGTLVGMSSSLLSRSVIGEGSLIAAGAVVLEGAEIEAGSLVAGVPGKVRRATTGEERAGFIEHARRYAELASSQPLCAEALALADVRFESRTRLARR